MRNFLNDLWQVPPIIIGTLFVWAYFKVFGIKEGFGHEED